MSKVSPKNTIGGSIEAKAGTRKNRILVVGDDKFIQESFRQILEMEGFGVDTAENGKQALEKAQSRHFDLVLVDGKLSDMSGEDLEAKMSAIASHIRVLELGMKPIDPKRLLEIVGANTRSIQDRP